MMLERPLVTVGALIIAPDGEILLVRAKKWSHLYSIPGGKVEWGETREEALKREIAEETKLQIVNMRFALVQECIFSSEFWQKKHFVMHDYVANLAEGNAKDQVILNSEADEFIWILPEKADTLPLHHECRVLIQWYLNHRNQ